MLRNKIATRGPSGTVPLTARLCLIDLRVTIEANWQLFATLFDQGASKRPDLKWLVRCNEIRNRLAHPMRLQNEPVTSAENRFLEERFRWLEQKVRDLRGG
jgi:hypothetical protein